MLILASALGACSSPATAIPQGSTTLTPARSATPSQIPPTPTSAPPSITPTPAPTLPPPATFSSRGLRPEVAPAAYIADACEALRLRWDPDRSPPGTVVAPIMFHSVRDPDNMVNDSVTISTVYLQAIVDRARALGFETITSEQLTGFLEENRRIPFRSMILFVDDRRPGTVEQYFLPLGELYDWSVTLSWIIADTPADLWAWMEQMNSTGHLDVQSHGYWHQYIVPQTPDETIREEIVDPIPVLQEHFGHRPTAFIWPGGNFTRRSVEVARQADYRLGFTAYSRGPLLFNWIPLGAEEAEVGDPLMVLPRYWSTAAVVNLDQAVGIAQEAETFAGEAYAGEAAWYRQTCGGELPPAPS